MILLLTLKGFFLLIHLMETVFINHINLRSGVIFFLLLCFFGSRGKKIAPSSRKQITEIKGEGMIACYNHISKVNPHIRQHFLANGGCLVPMRPKIHVAAPFPRQKKNVGVMVRIHLGYRERTGREVTSVHGILEALMRNETGTKV